MSIFKIRKVWTYAYTHKQAHLRFGGLAHHFEWIAAVGKREARVTEVAHNFCARHQYCIDPAQKKHDNQGALSDDIGY